MIWLIEILFGIVSTCFLIKLLVQLNMTEVGFQMKVKAYDYIHVTLLFINMTMFLVLLVLAFSYPKIDGEFLYSIVFWLLLVPMIKNIVYCALCVDLKEVPDPDNATFFLYLSMVFIVPDIILITYIVVTINFTENYIGQGLTEDVITAGLILCITSLLYNLKTAHFIIVKCKKQFPTYDYAIWNYLFSLC